MEKLVCEKISRIIKNREKLEKLLNVKIKNRGKEVSIEGRAEDEYVAEKIIEALEFGFPFSTAMLLKEQDFMLEVINVKDHTKRKDLERIRARIIGRHGKTLKTLQTLTMCHFEIKDNHVGVIGDPEHIRNAHEAVISLIRGAKQSNVYSFLEKHQVKHVFDLGLKDN